MCPLFWLHFGGGALGGIFYELFTALPAWSPTPMLVKAISQISFAKSLKNATIPSVTPSGFMQ